MRANLKLILKKAAKTAWLIAKLILPLYILVDVLNYLGALAVLAKGFAPLTAALGLPAPAALALAGGGFFNLYTGIALAAPLGLSAHQWTVVGVFMGFFHSILIEAAVLRKLGIPVLQTFFLRLGAGCIGGFAVSRMPAQWFGEAVTIEPLVLKTHATFQAMLFDSLQSGVLLTLKVAVLIAGLIIVFDLVKASKRIGGALKKADSTFKMLVGMLLGVTYGAGLLLEDNTNSQAKRQILVGAFLMMAHGLIEETLLFTMFGASAWPIIGARLLAGVVTVGGFWFFFSLKNVTKLERVAHEPRRSLRSHS